MVRCQASGVDCWCRTGGRPRRGCQRLRTGDAGAAPRLSRADGPGPFPAAGGLHGCIGLSGHSVTIADRLKSPGHVALAVDSLGPRAAGVAEFELLRGCRSWFAATPRRGRGDDFRNQPRHRFGSRRRHDGFPRSSEADLLCHCRTPLRIGWRDDWVTNRQLPADAIRRWFQPMSVAEMPA
jgi:hypothetical protein